MKYFGYDRGNTTNNSTISDYSKKNNIQVELIIDNTNSYDNYNRLCDELDDNNTLIIESLDILGDQQEILEKLCFLKNKKVRLMVLNLPATLIEIDGYGKEIITVIKDNIYNMIFDMYQYLSPHLKKRRTKDNMKDNGRPKVMDFDVFVEAYMPVENGEMTPYQLMIEMDMSKSTFYRYKKMYEESRKLTNK